MGLKTARSPLPDCRDEDRRPRPVPGRAGRRSPRRRGRQGRAAAEDLRARCEAVARRFPKPGAVVAETRARRRSWAVWKSTSEVGARNHFHVAVLGRAGEKTGPAATTYALPVPGVAPRPQVDAALPLLAPDSRAAPTPRVHRSQSGARGCRQALGRRSATAPRPRRGTVQGEGARCIVRSRTIDVAC